MKKAREIFPTLDVGIDLVPNQVKLCVFFFFVLSILCCIFMLNTIRIGRSTNGIKTGVVSPRFGVLQKQNSMLVMGCWRKMGLSNIEVKNFDRKCDFSCGRIK